MSDQTLPLPQTTLKTRELIEFPQNDHSLNAPPAAESIASENDEKTLNQTDIPKVPSKESKDAKGFQRLSKLFGRNRVSKNAEEISLDSSRTPDTRSAISNDSQMDYSGQRVSSRLLPNIGSHLKRLMRLKSSTREIKTEEEVIIVGVPKGSLAVPVPVLETDEIEVHPGNPDSNQIAESDRRTSDSLESDLQKTLISSGDLLYSNESENKKPDEIGENYQVLQNSTTSSAATSEIRSSATVDYNIMVTPISSVIPETVTTPQQNLPNDINDESIVVTPVLVPVPVPVPVVVQNDFENDIPAVAVESPPPPSAAFHLITATLNAPTQLGPNQAEAGIQVSRRSAAAAVRQDLTMPFLYLEEEARVEPYTQTILGGENDSITTGSESSDVTSEVADANEQREGRDAAEQYYNAVLLRAILRKHLNRLDDEPPFY